ncbi:hypothetical protein HBI56_221030 [Parastagonospora nodorum]|nr:hypothetical protein HBH51_246440 [Parastagonospora nodorum]KAH4013440.1 hypothetical protein HBI09_214820 [Parastagonospora nodorum]KAH4216838.1 hypothetical protein HBI06_223190 [Parastagonospora nodorum]KAH4226212.1 hypothetical protein HBI05_224860 [Parastagonospora nodorum]KAH4335464.1 hypothetical protein HBH98_233990 [Parastagonospora nodorum]
MSDQQETMSSSPAQNATGSPFAYAGRALVRGFNGLMRSMDLAQVQTPTDSQGKPYASAQEQMAASFRTEDPSSGGEQIGADSAMAQTETPDANANPTLLDACELASGRGDEGDIGVSEETLYQQNAVEPEEMDWKEDAASVQAHQGEKRKRGEGPETESGASSGKKQRVSNGRDVRTMAPRRNPNRAARPVQKLL